MFSGVTSVKSVPFSNRNYKCPSDIIPTNSCNFLTEEITGARDYNFGPEFSQNGGGWSFRPKFCTFWRYCSNKKRFSDSPKFR